MKKAVIKKIAEQSYTRGKLDQSKVDIVEKNLKREDLKVYIKELRTIEAKNSLIVTLPSEAGMEEIKKQLTNLYPTKDIYFEIDETLIAGVRIQDFDNLYELSLQNFLEGATHSRND